MQNKMRESLINAEVPDILDFLDYREFLMRCLDAARRRNHRLSNRWLGQRMGVSGAQIANVLARRRKLDRGVAAEAAPALGLAEDRAEYLPLLVDYNDSTDGLSAVQAWRRLCLIRAKHGRPLGEGVGSCLLLRWYIPVVLEQSMQPGWCEDPAWIASRISPSISTAQAADAVALLRAAGYLTGRPDGAPPVARAPEWMSAELLMRFHDECLDVAAEAKTLSPSSCQFAEIELPLTSEAGALGATMRRWHAAVESEARAVGPSNRKSATYLFLAHAFQIGTPPP